MTAGKIRVGIGGWDYEPWRETFYPPKLAKTKQLEYAAQHVTAIEINATYYKLQSPALFEKWAKTVPDGFKFALKGSRFCSNRRVLGEGGEGVERFCGQGLTELGDKLGPIVWQFMATKRFDPDDFRAFLALLPRMVTGVRLQHAVEVRHDSFRDPAFVEMARAGGVAIVFSDGKEFPVIADASGDFTYTRLLGARAEEPTGYPATELDHWAETARGWAAGESPEGLAYVAAPAPAAPRDVYVFMINGAKERAPAAAMALLERL